MKGNCGIILKNCEEIENFKPLQGRNALTPSEAGLKIARLEHLF